MSFSWGRFCRLRRERDIRLVYSQGTRVKMSRGALFFLPAVDMRLAISVSKKAGCAVIRNRQKRLVREFFRLHKHQFCGSYWIVVVVYRPYKGFKDFSSELDETCRKAGIISCEM